MRWSGRLGLAAAEDCRTGHYVDLLSVVPGKRLHSFWRRAESTARSTPTGERFACQTFLARFTGDFFAITARQKRCELPDIIYLLIEWGPFSARGRLIEFSSFGGRFITGRLCGASTGHILYARDERSQIESAGKVKNTRLGNASRVLPISVVGTRGDDLQALELRAFMRRVLGDCLTRIDFRNPQFDGLPGSATSLLPARREIYGEFIQVHPTFHSRRGQLRLMSEIGTRQAGAFGCRAIRRILDPKDITTPSAIIS